MFGNNGAFSYAPGGISQEDFPQRRRAFQQDDPKDSPLQRNGMSRPSGRNIYMQRKEYSETMNRQPENVNVRVEHLFTCELDGREVRSVENCVAKLKKLDASGRVWAQEMIMQIQGAYLLLCDIETKAELESIPLNCISQTKAVLDSCVYNSLLTITVQEHSRPVPQVFMFQCEETKAEVIKSDLDKAVKRGGARGGADRESRREPPGMRANLENIMGQHTLGNFQQGGPRPLEHERTPPPSDFGAPQWNNRGPEYMPPPPTHPAQESMPFQRDPHEFNGSPDIAPQITEIQRNTEILNHVLDDLEIFLGKVSAAGSNASTRHKKSKKIKGFKNKSKKIAPANDLPHWEEYVYFLQKIKYGFNLLGQLDGSLVNPEASDYVHIFFSNLGAVVPRYPEDLPPTVVSPLLTEAALGLLTETLTPDEDRLWKFLGECWFIPRSNWPDGNVPPYIPEFYDGWQPQPPAHGPMSRSPGGAPRNEGQGFSPRQSQRHFEKPVDNGPWSPPPSAQSSEPPLHMRVIYDFVPRNNRELNVVKGEVVQVIQRSKQWWLVRNSFNAEGNVPQKVLEPVNSGGPMEEPPRDSFGPVTLDMHSTPGQVKAWLDYKGFSKITISSLGVLNGQLLLGMSKDDIRTVCPEEGGKVFFQLQAVKSSIALASEPSGPNNGPYGGRY
ncbi:epidermal growth factor receptor kinase substrate 8-like protein 3b [Cololabis saira]|uniref:epidermal growth factor receptor kinase substrate 8-like protein 3b n=1 Tax=Cololabis saira TaxID=129043 RepID=UPI002AD451EA|nr:epidermal growth factor receptor kinase substrate 8-like protein 3b [Cololabis saira]